MGLLQNLSYLNAEPVNYFGGIAIQCLDICRFSRHGSELNFMISEADNYDGGGKSQLQKSGFPNGYRDPYQITLPIKNGGMSCYSGVVGGGNVELDLKQGKAFSTNLIVGSGTVSPGLSALAHLTTTLGALVGSGRIEDSLLGVTSALSASISGSGTIVPPSPTFLAYCDANLVGQGIMEAGELQLVVGLAANLLGNGNLEGAANLVSFLAAQIGGSGAVSSADIEAVLALSASMAGSGTITTAQITSIAHLASEVFGQGAIEDAAMRLDCYMGAEITSAGELVTAQSCAQAVWSTMAAAFNDPGTTGNKLNSASAAGDPWTAELPGAYPAGTAGAIMGFMVKVLTNKREVKKVGDTWTLLVYDDDGTTPILNKPLKDVTGGEIADLAAGVLAAEDSSTA